MFSKILIYVLSIFFIIVTTLPSVRSDYWTFRILEYPRLQKLILGVLALIILLVNKAVLDDGFWWLTVPVFAGVIFLLVKIIPYTIFGKKEMIKAVDASTKTSLKIFTANVLQTNNEFEKLYAQIKEKDPDIIFLVETDKKWQAAMEKLKKNYPYYLEHPLDNTYGLLFFSRLEVEEKKVRFWVEDEIPSIDATVLLKNGTPVKLYGLHPKPPVPKESMYSTAKDKELMKVALKIEHFEDPCIVMGDLNDVAWSHVTMLFRKVSSLLDPRRGRGFYSTFSANNQLMRFPLDYIFCSNHFALVSMRRMPHFGSDHFGMFIHLNYSPRIKAVQEKPEADTEEKEEALNKASKTVEE